MIRPPRNHLYFKGLNHSDYINEIGSRSVSVRAATNAQTKVIGEVVENQYTKVVVMGAGAVGCYFGGLLAKSGVPVTLIGREQHVDAINRDGLYIDGINFKGSIQVASTTNIQPVADADVVLFCVKTLDTESAAKSIAPLLKSGASVLCLQNGADNVERMQASAGIDAIAAAVYVGVQFSAPGKLKHNGRGDLIVGSTAQKMNAKEQERLETISAMFNNAGIPCEVSDKIKAILWEKLTINCAYNAISALTKSNYTAMMSQPSIKEMMATIVEECIATAFAEGIQLQRDYVINAVYKLGDTMGNQISSTAQDLQRGKLTEIDSLNGYVSRKGKLLNVSTPVNTTLHALVKLLEHSVQQN